jgi:hypothetical protein
VYRGTNDTILLRYVTRHYHNVKLVRDHSSNPDWIPKLIPKSTANTKGVSDIPLIHFGEVRKVNSKFVPIDILDQPPTLPLVREFTVLRKDVFVYPTAHLYNPGVYCLVARMAGHISCVISGGPKLAWRDSAVVVMSQICNMLAVYSTVGVPIGKREFEAPSIAVFQSDARKILILICGEYTRLFTSSPNLRSTF